ncbi:MAG: hypothetical protein A3A80_01235 [Candidatus Terrybacteria bacterium RIFCSPLOWO2_01_FULL_44_24]|nr:MAG: hypothetical protein A3B75_02680 [Candidatus Terrybacteria bacterium RIFCSPHIGHO2_02_FULL_43_14]OHA51707.1 MAG: hypothetical protein A3A80_01235 [Candidatus Terrybacteria bacterium RIFCSPLOWO2_01_FULL_44_24]
MANFKSKKRIGFNNGFEKRDDQTISFSTLANGLNPNPKSHFTGLNTPLKNRLAEPIGLDIILNIG